MGWIAIIDICPQAELLPDDWTQFQSLTLTSPLPVIGRSFIGVGSRDDEPFDPISASGPPLTTAVVREMPSFTQPRSIRAAHPRTGTVA